MKINPIILSFLVILFIGVHSANSQTTKNKEITDLIQKKRAYNKKNGFGFRIQLDNGLERVIKTTKSKFALEHPTIKTYIKYESPEWKIQVGDYKTRLEADKALIDIKLKFKSAIVVPR